LGYIYLRNKHLATIAQRVVLSIPYSIRSVYAKKVNAHMKPTEKAKDLIIKFGNNTKCFSETKGWDDSFYDAKQCALIAVDEILNANGLHPNDTDYDYNKAELYWQEVKQEIENL
jgi:hypothetical protein